MEQTSSTNFAVTISQDDFLGWLALHTGDLPLTSATIAPPSENDGRALSIVFPVDTAYLDAFLHTVIPELPAEGSYSYQVYTNSPSMIARVMWTA